MLRRIRQTIIERKLLHPGMHIITGVSGGADSTALLYALWFLRQQLDFHLSAAHLHHGLRGHEADLDALHVEQMCLRLEIPLHLKREHVYRDRVRRGVSFEMAAREARHEFFIEVLKETKADAVALAHTRNDQVETLLMRILTGTGIEGLAGMDYSGQPVPGLLVIRPMLDVSREMIEAFLIRHRLGWREDQSNQDRNYVRNRIRHGILPFLEEQGFKGVRASLVRLSEIMREEAKLIDLQSEALLKKSRSRKSGGGLLIKHLSRLCLAEQRRVIRRWLLDAGINDRALEFSLIERVRFLAARGGTGRVQINPEKQVRILSDSLAIQAVAPAGTLLADIKPTRISVPGRTVLKEAGLVIKATRTHGFSRKAQEIGKYPAVLYIHRKWGEFPKLMVRSRQTGDFIQPTGMTGRVMVKDLLIDRKVPYDQRPRIPVFVAGGEVVWVAGYRVAKAWAVASDKAPSWRITIERMA